MFASFSGKGEQVLVLRNKFVTSSLSGNRGEAQRHQLLVLEIPDLAEAPTPFRELVASTWDVVLAVTLGGRTPAGV